MVTTTWLLMVSISIFHTVVRRLIKMTLSGQPCRMPLVACHHAPSAPARRNARRSCRYMAARARSTPSSMPNSRAIRRTTACRMRSKHLT